MKPHLETLINDELNFQGQRHGRTFILSHTLLKTVILMHEEEYFKTKIGTTLYNYLETLS